VAPGRRAHLLEQLRRRVGVQQADAVDQLVADALELLEPEQSRAGLRRGELAPAGGLAPREAAGERRRQLALEPGMRRS